jgi:YD repeat-containing protein
MSTKIVTTKWIYDNEGRPVKATTSDGKAHEWQYNEIGQVTTEITIETFEDPKFTCDCGKTFKNAAGYSIHKKNCKELV